MKSNPFHCDYYIIPCNIIKNKKESGSKACKNKDALGKNKLKNKWML
jgi:hypothetical protein